MALPALAKTWQHSVNNSSPAQGSAATDNRRMLRLIKDALVGFGSNPWTVQGSCNGAGGAGSFSQPPGGTDKWLTDADLVGNTAGSNHSWIVLRQTGIAANFELCIDLAASTANACTIVVSPAAGFTGGSATARPTATDEIVLISTTTFTANSADVAIRWSVSQSTDGQCTRIWWAAAGAVCGWMLFDKPGNPTSGWSNPSASWAMTGVPTAANLFGSNGRMRSGSTNGNVCMLVEGYTTNLGPNDTVFGNIANEIDSAWPMYPLGFACVTTGVRGRHGSLVDAWAGSAAVGTGDTYPNDASNQFVQIGALILPWNGGAVNLTLWPPELEPRLRRGRAARPPRPTGAVRCRRRSRRTTSPPCASRCAARTA